MDSICRLCCSKSSNLTSIFSFKRERLLSDIILILCPIRIDPADELPKSVCEQCLLRLLSAMNLREMSVKSDFQLRQLAVPADIPDISHMELNLPPVDYENDFDPNDYEQNGYETQNDQPLSENYPEDHSVIPFASNVRYKPKQMQKIEKVKNLQCPLCPASYATAGFVKRHMNIMHGEYEPPLKVAKLTSDRRKSATTTAVQSNISQDSSSSSSNPVTASDADLSLAPDYLCHIFNQEASKHIKVLALNPPHTFTYKCLLCDGNEGNEEKKFVQEIKNRSLSNFRRHLKRFHNVGNEGGGKEMHEESGSRSETVQEEEEKDWVEYVKQEPLDKWMV